MQNVTEHLPMLKLYLLREYDPEQNQTSSVTLWHARGGRQSKRQSAGEIATVVRAVKEECLLGRRRGKFDSVEGWRKLS